MHHAENLYLVLATAAVALVVLASRVGIPYPIFLLLGGLLLSLVPGMPTVEIEPDVVLVGLLPPLLYSGAFFMPLREFKANLRPIALLSIVVVLLTTVSVAVFGHFVLGLSWPVAFVLGAIVSPTDPVAFEAVAHRLPVPRRLTSIVQGESLVNDGMALAIYASAVTAVTAGTVSGTGVALHLLGGIVGGVLVGLAVGWLLAQLRRRVDSPPEELAISLLAAYGAYIPAEQLGVSGILAAVTIGFYHGRHQSRLISATTRIQTFSFWEMLVFLINAGLFIVVGLQLPGILDDLRGSDQRDLLLAAAGVTAVVIAVRVLWVGGFTVLLRGMNLGHALARPLPGRYAVVISATGMRGAVSLAAALAVPLEVGSGEPFPDRELLIFLAFAVIVATLVPQGLALPRLLRRLDLLKDEETAREEAEARRAAARAAAERLEQLREEEWVDDDLADRLERLYTFRQQRFSARLDGGDGTHVEEQVERRRRLRRELLEAERTALVALNEEGRIDGDVMRRVQHDLDLEDNRLMP